MHSTEIGKTWQKLFLVAGHPRSDRLFQFTSLAHPAKRVYIPKGKNEKRPIGIPALESKIVERGITWILESIYERDFLNGSYGFRPDRNCHQAQKRQPNTFEFLGFTHYCANGENVAEHAQPEAENEL